MTPKMMEKVTCGRGMSVTAKYMIRPESKAARRRLRESFVLVVVRTTAAVMRAMRVSEPRVTQAAAIMP